MTTISEQFEKQKITDLKEILTNFILIQLKYHSAALEVLTASYQEIASIDEKEDLEVNSEFNFITSFLNFFVFLLPKGL